MTNTEVHDLKKGDVLRAKKGRKSSNGYYFKNYEHFVYKRSEYDHWTGRYYLYCDAKLVDSANIYSKKRMTGVKLLHDSVEKGALRASFDESGFDDFFTF